jgi:sulfatase modifying factor 1
MENSPTKSRMLCGLSVIVFMLCALLEVPAFAFDKVVSNSLGMEFVLIQAGTFTMGSPSDEPFHENNEGRHKVTITQPFYMQSTEVTLKQWRSLMGERIFGRKKGTDNSPVVNVSWHDCMDFIEKLNALREGTYRLPTEAEWEYACRAGSSTAYSWGKTIECEKALYGNNSLKEGECLDYARSRGFRPDSPAPVKSYQPNAWGLSDMHGNVWEWCQDWYGPYPKNAVGDPLGPESGQDKVRRGGSWYKYGYYCRSANRTYAHPSARYQTTGFRLVREAR